MLLFFYFLWRLSEHFCICLRIDMWADWRHLDDAGWCLPVAAATPSCSSCWPSPAVQTCSHMVYRLQGTSSKNSLATSCRAGEFRNILPVVCPFLTSKYTNVSEFVPPDSLYHFMLLIVNGSFTVYVDSVHSWTHHHIWFYPCAISVIINVCPCWLPPSPLSMAGLQRAAVHARDARCSGDVDRQGSHPHQCETAGDAAGFLQISAAEHQTPRRRCAPHHVGTFLFCSDSAAFLLVPLCLMDIWLQRIVLFTSTISQTTSKDKSV